MSLVLAELAESDKVRSQLEESVGGWGFGEECSFFIFSEGYGSLYIPVMSHNWLRWLFDLDCRSRSN